MKYQNIRSVVESVQLEHSSEEVKQLANEVIGKKPAELVPEEKLEQRKERLEEEEQRPSPVAEERILGINDLVDVYYLRKGLEAATAVGRIILRDRSWREIGYATGFKVSPHLLLTNHHVFETQLLLENALVEFNFELGINGQPLPSTRFKVNPRAFFMADKNLDYALVAIDPNRVFGEAPLSNFTYLRLNPEVGKINVGEFATIIQHPGGQPKQIAIRENTVLEINEKSILYKSDTAQGSSGSPVLNDSWQVIALHSSGVPKTDANGKWLLKDGSPAQAGDDDADIDWIANIGTRASRIVKHVLANAPDGPLTEEFRQVCLQDMPVSQSPFSDNQTTVPTNSPGHAGPSIPQGPNTELDKGNSGAPVQQTFSVPLQISVSLGKIEATIPQSPQPLTNDGPSIGVTESKKKPFIDEDYRTRKGYDANFLGVEVPLPEVKSRRNLSRLANRDIYLPYHHFTIVNDKVRKLALFTASNIDAKSEMKEPEPGFAYTRAALAGLSDKDTEEWFTDPRIPAEDQLSDEFYNKDRMAFDKGHIVRREDVAWGHTHDEVREANGDTYHITNCSPQVKDFNQSRLHGIWGLLENEVLKQSQVEKYCLFAGPVLLPKDPIFKGVNQRKGIEVKIPRAYWKVVVALGKNGQLEAFGFLLQQDLSKVQFEFDLKEEWKMYNVSIQSLEAMLKNVEFPPVVKAADQFQLAPVEQLMERFEELLPGQ